MIRKQIARLFGTMAALALLAGCGNGNNDAGQILRALPKALFTKDPPPSKVTPEVIAQALQRTQGPVVLIELEKREGVQFLMLEIQRNGPYQSFGSSSRQVINFRNGMATSTRGLGGDLMSTEEDALLRLVRHRQSGTATYVQRFLTPEDVTQTFTYTCEVLPGENASVSLAGLKTTGFTMAANCEGDGARFTDLFVVSTGGYILNARQWLGLELGYVSSMTIRG